MTNKLIFIFCEIADVINIVVFSLSSFLHNKNLIFTSWVQTYKIQACKTIIPVINSVKKSNKVKFKVVTICFLVLPKSQASLWILNFLWYKNGNSD